MDIQKTESGVQTTQIDPITLLNKAVESGANIEHLERLLDLQEKWMQQQSKQNFYKAFNEFQNDKPIIKKNKRVEFKGKLQYEFADLSSIQRVVDPLLSSVGLSYSWKQTNHGNGALTIECVLKHIDGYTESNNLTANPDKSGSKNDIQAIGSGVSYLKRYTLLNALGLSVGDDDGQGTSLTPEEIQEAEKQVIADLLMRLENKIPSALFQRASEIIQNNEHASYKKAINTLRKHEHSSK